MTGADKMKGFVYQDLACLQAMGIPVWVRRSTAAPTANVIGQHNATGEPVQAIVQAHSPVPDWDSLRQRVASCHACGLDKTRTQTVFGTGNPLADVLFVGEAPGADEDRLGEPFVGRAGQLLNAMLRAMGFGREQVYIANVLKCRPPGNRDPQPEEVACCEPYLLEQIALINPRVIVALGRHAAHSLMKTDMPLSRLRGQRLDYHGIPLIATYHPAYLLRNPADKKKSWEDLRLVKQLIVSQVLS